MVSPADFHFKIKGCEVGQFYKKQSLGQNKETVENTGSDIMIGQEKFSVWVIMNSTVLSTAMVPEV